jgi:hypothetical protein
MNYFYYSSKKSPPCDQIYQKLRSIPQLFNTFNKIDVSDPKVQIPSNIKIVPSILIKSSNGKYSLYSGQQVFDWINQWISMNSRSQPAQQSTQHPPQQQSPQQSQPQQPQQPGFEDMWYDPMLSGTFSGSALYTSPDWKDLPPLDDGKGNYGTSSYTLLNPMSSKTESKNDAFLSTVETKEKNKEDEMKRRLKELETQREMEVPGTIARQG